MGQPCSPTEGPGKSSSPVSAKSLRVERIRNPAAKAYLDQRHPLGSGRAFTFALGVFLADRLQDVLTVGSPICNNAGKAIGLKQHEFFELHKMHLLDSCPRNSESRVLSILAILIRKHYPQVKAIITYCDSEEAATAYKASGWKAGKANRYVREVRVGAKWFSIRDANRYGLTSQATEKRYESRRKWIYPLCPEVAALV